MRTQATNCPTRNLVLAAATFLLVLLFAACASEVATTPSPTLEPGRTNIREGLFLRGTEFGDANFSAVLPEGWAAADAPDYPVAGRTPYPTGVLVNPEGEHLTLGYSIRSPGETDLRIFPSHRLEIVTIDGIPVKLMVPEDLDVQDDFRRIHAVFPWLPGDENQSFGLSIDATGIQGREMFDETRSLIESIKYAPPPKTPAPVPSPEVTPAPDWARVYAHERDNPSNRIFSVLAPRGWEFTYLGGYDSFVGSFTNGEITIGFDYGSVAGSFVGFENHLRDPDYYPEHLFWVEVIDNKPFIMFRPTSDDQHKRASTGVNVDRIPGLPDLVLPEGSYSSVIYDCGGSFGANSIDHQSQELVLAILRTLQAETQPSWCR